MRYLLIVLIVIVLAGVMLKKVWPQYDQNTASPSTSNQFEVVYNQQIGQLGTLQVILDKDTGNKYLYYKYGFGAGMTQLLDKAVDNSTAK